MQTNEAINRQLSNGAINTQLRKPVFYIKITQIQKEVTHIGLCYDGVSYNKKNDFINEQSEDERISEEISDIFKNKSKPHTPSKHPIIMTSDESINGKIGEAMKKFRNGVAKEYHKLRKTNYTIMPTESHYAIKYH